MTKREIAKLDILNILSNTVHGPIKAKGLSMFAMLTETDQTYPGARALVLELIEEGHCIGSNSQGYFLMKTGKEVQEYLNSLLQRQMGISRRIQSVYDAAKKGGIF